METKICTKCGTELPLEDFYKDSRHKDGKQSACKPCVRRTNRKWKSKNKDRVDEYNRQYTPPPGIDSGLLKDTHFKRVKKYWNHKCALCRNSATTFGMVLAEKFGGEPGIYNIIPECADCNNKKKDTDLFFYSILTGVNIGDVLAWAAHDIDLIKKLSHVRERYYNHSFKPQMKMALLKAMNLLQADQKN